MGMLLLDPYVLALPAAETEEMVSEYAARLLGLEELRDLGLCDFFLTNRAGEVLDRTGSFPLWDTLGDFAAGYRRDILRVVYGFLERIRTLEDEAGVVDVLVDECVAEPAAHLGSRAAAFVEAYHRTFALAYVLQNCANGRLQGAVVLTDGVGLERADELRDQGCLVIVEWMNAEDDRATIELPRRFAVGAPGVGRVSVLSLIYEPTEAWTRGLLREAVDLAVIQRQPRQYVPEGQKWPRHAHPWVLGPGFRSSVEELQIDRTPLLLKRLLEACADTVLGNALAHAHRLRTSQGGAASARVRARDGAIAWRRDVTHELHLHYWSTPDGPEIACAAPHNTFGIPE